MMNIDDTIDILGVDLLGVVPDDEKVVISTNKGEPAVLDENSLAGQAYRNIAKRLMGENVPIMDLDMDEGFLAKLKRWFSIGKKRAY